MTTLRIPLPPTGFQRPRPTGRGNAFYSPHHPALQDWQQLIKNQMRRNGAPIIETPCSVWMNIGAEATLIEVEATDIKRPKHVRQDIDNITKFVNDAMQGFVFLDDRQVMETHTRFVDAEYLR